MSQEDSPIFSRSRLHFSIPNQGHTTIYSTQNFSPVWSIPTESSLISFQYDTGLIAVVGEPPNIVSFYDFKYKRHVKDIDFILPVLKFLYLKNLLIVVAERRIVAYDLSRDQFILYIEIQDGRHVFISEWYETLSLAYIDKTGHFINHSVWEGEKLFELKEVKFEEGRYSPMGDYFVLRSQKELRVFTKNSMINIIPLTDQFVDYVFSPLKKEVPSLVVAKRTSEGKIRLESFCLFKLREAEEEWKLVSEKSVGEVIALAVYVTGEEIHVVEFEILSTFEATR